MQFAGVARVWHSATMPCWSKLLPKHGHRIMPQYQKNKLDYNGHSSLNYRHYAVVSGRGTDANSPHARTTMTSDVRGMSSEATDVGVGSFPNSAQVVVCGGGVVGCSVALHLAMDGAKDVVLLEQGSLTCGTTWHSVGQLGRLKGSHLATQMAAYSLHLYKQLEAEGFDLGFKECGSVYSARTKDRMVAYKRYLQSGSRIGIEGEIISPEEIQKLVPHLHVEDLEGAVWIPGDGVFSAPDVAMAMARKAKQLGVKIHERTKVTYVNTNEGQVKSVETDRGHIDCDVFVNCSGMWARDLGQLCDVPVRVPLHPCEHFYIITKPIDGVDRMMPVVRDYDGFIYMREWSGGILCGGFEPVAKPVFHDGIPDGFEYQLLPEDWDHFQVLLEQMIHRVPVMEEAQVKQLINGPESFTPDGRYILGEAPEVQNYFVAAGMNSSGITAAGGIGRYISEWITQGEPTRELWMYDIRRFVDLHNNKKFLRDRVKETVGMHALNTPSPIYRRARDIKMSPLYPRQASHGAVFDQFGAFERAVYFRTIQENAFCGCLHHAKPTPHYESARHIKMSPIYPRLEQRGGAFDQFGAYERAVYFNDPKKMSLDSSSESESSPRGSFGKPNWFDKVKSEYWACREGVCLIDMSTFTKFQLKSAGTEVVDFLQYVCSNDVDRPVGTVIHTGMQNRHGGYENDCSVVRTGENEYFMIGPTAQQTRSLAWLRDHLPKDGSVIVSDVTSMYTALNVIGPKAPELLGELTDSSLKKTDFQHMTCKELDVGQASGIKAMRLTHSGEEGWILYIPSEYALHVYDSLMEVGKNYGVRNAGYYALRALRTEKFFAYWGTDLTPQCTPLECGRDFRVKFEMGKFIGYEALSKQKALGIKKKLVQFLIEDHDLDNDLWPWGGEPIYRNDKFCGTTTSTAYGFTLDRHVCLAYVRDIDSNDGQENYITNDFILDKHACYEIDIAGQRFPLKANIYPPQLKSAALVVNKPHAQSTSTIF